ncbi:hypothetical protein LMG28138_00330 [Pararobbsia alpina]|uniref:Uncharacterized protein n=1 Tax=Pararobbsia alpina TaxID=621374 RepID=A0A6S7CCX1_9BURK|nr:hypothetical protein LMG28138_00330 [Pararobbsia alpina]
MPQLVHFVTKCNRQRRNFASNSKRAVELFFAPEVNTHSHGVLSALRPESSRAQNGLTTTSITTASRPSTGSSLKNRYQRCGRMFSPRSKRLSRRPQAM